MSKEMEYVEALAQQIGARPATSEAEYQAAEWIAEKFSQHNLTPETQNFTAPATMAWTYVIYGLLSVLAAGVCGLTWWLRPVSLVVSLLVAILFFTDNQLIWGLSSLFAKHPSQNIIAKHQPRGGRGERSRKIIIVTHYDTPRSAAFPGLAKSTSLLFSITKWCTWAIPVFIIVQMLVGPAAKSWVWYASFIPAVFILFTVIVHLLDQVLGKDVEGANNNASGVASMLGVLDKVVPLDDEGTPEKEASRTVGERISAAQDTASNLFGKEVIEDAGIAPSEAGIEYAVPVTSRIPEGASVTGKMKPVAPESPSVGAPAEAPASSGIMGKGEPVTPAPAAAPVELPAEGFPISLTADETQEPAPAPAPAAPAPEPKPAPAPAPEPTPQVQVPSIGQEDERPPALSTEIPSIDEIAMPGATQAFAPVSSGAPAAPASAPAQAMPTVPAVSDSPDMSAAFTPAPAPAPEQVEGWESPTTAGATEEFTSIPESRVRELGSQVTGMFSKIVPTRKKKKSKKDDEEEALGSWLDGGNKKSSSSDPWNDDSDDDSFGWQGGAVLADGEEFASLTTEQRIAAIKESVLSVSDRDLLDKEVWFVATGAKEVGAFGMQAFVREYGAELRGALIMNIDSVGTGDLSWITNEGTVKTYSADRRLVVLARRLSRSENIGIGAAKLKGVMTDTLAALIKGHNAMTITALDGAMPANYRSDKDTIEEVDPNNIADTVKLVTGIIRES